MHALYGAYLIRCWRKDGEISRLEVTHIQSGKRVLLRSMASALEWIEQYHPEAKRPERAQQREEVNPPEDTWVERSDPDTQDT